MYNASQLLGFAFNRSTSPRAARHRAARVVVTLAMLLAFGSSVQAATKTWNNGSTDGLWNTAGSANWAEAPNTWANYDDAFFGAAGTSPVTISGAVYANKVNFTSDGYLITGATLNMGNPGGINNFNVTGANTATISANISQPYGTAIQKIGTGTLKLSGTVTSTVGNNRIEYGKLDIAGGSFAGNVFIADSAGTTGTLDVSGGTLTSSGLSVVATRGVGTLNVNGGTAHFNGGLYMGYASVGSVGSSTVNLSSGTMTVGSGGSGDFILGQDNDAGSTSIFSQTGGTFTHNGGVLYIGNLGAGTQTLSVSNGSFTSTTNSMLLAIRGTATMNISGTGSVTLPGLQFGHGSTSGETGNLNLDGGTLTIGASGITSAATTANFNFNGGTLKASANFGMSGLTTATVKSGGAIIDTNTKDITIGQALVAGAPSGGLTKNGAGTLTISTNPTYTGDTTVNQGTLSFTSTSNWTVPGNIVINGGTYDLAGGGRQVNMNNPSKTITFGASGGTLSLNSVNFYPSFGAGQTLSISTTAGAPQSLITASALSGSVGINTDNDLINFNVALGTDATTDLLVNAPLWNGGAAATVTKSGGGRLTLAGANVYTGSTTVSDGKLILQNTNASSSYAIASGATLEFNGGGTGTTTFSGAGKLVKSDAGMLVWGATAATFSLSSGALIDVQNGTFVGGSSANEVWTSNLSDLNVGGSGIFRGVEANVRVDALTGTGIIRSGFAGAGYANFTFGVDNGSGTFDGTLTNDSSTGNFVKVGSGTQILSGNNSYSGTTTVDGGTLLVNGTNSGGGFVVVNSGATLGGNGEISNGSLVTVGNGGTIAPGTSPGTLTMSNLQMVDGSTYKYEPFDLIAVSDTLALYDNWTLRLDNTSPGLKDGGSLVLFTFGTLTGAAGIPYLTPTFDTLLLGFSPSGPLSLSVSGSSILLNGISLVPEPTTFLLALPGLLSLGFFGWRRRRRA